jgi:hypothetical protein
LEKKAACPFLSGSVGEKSKQKAVSHLLKLQSMEMFAVKANNLFL